MNAEELIRRLRDERIVPMAAAEWAELAEACEVVERVLRRLSDAEEAGHFVKDRLEAYERMWDGCGCKIDYYK
ncbi:MAG: hypothetical protein JSW46_17585 [Gemmatimonadota bacterium]|nr:MAG: hypothetical protein JSW46_17585 [Gemmatimonadota bacterium]